MNVLLQGFSKLIQAIVISMKDLKIDVAALKNTVYDNGKAYGQQNKLPNAQLYCPASMLNLLTISNN